MKGEQRLGWYTHFCACSKACFRLERPNWIIGYYRMFQNGANARMRLCACAGWCGSAHFLHARRHFFRLTRSTLYSIKQNEDFQDKWYICRVHNSVKMVLPLFHLSERGLYSNKKKRNICSSCKQFFPFWVDPFIERIICAIKQIER